MVFSTQLLIIALVALVVSSVGWIKFVYFISLGYGFSIAAIGVALILMFIPNISPEAVILCILFIIYGCRLGGFLLFREIKSVSYKKEMPNLTKTSKPMGAGAKIAIWLSVVVLYVCQVSPVLFRLTNHSVSSVWAFIGSAVMAIALIIESTADFQKSQAKKINPQRFCDNKLYKIVRCPNYFAEILFWTGVFLSGIGSLSSVGQWIIAVIGYLGIVYIMFGGARRLEIRQSKRYGNDPEYQAYCAKTPILIPLVPLYHLENATFFKG